MTSDRPRAFNSTLPARSGYMTRSPMQPRTVPPRAVPLPSKSAATRTTSLRPVSPKRQRENRKRAVMADRRWPDRREGAVMCGCGRPGCNRRADDLHEILTRGRGGSITDEANVVPLARECHEEITTSPESELGWAYRAGLLKHDGLCCQGRAACARYAEDGAA